MAKPAPAGYSGKPLHAKLGFKPGWRVGLVDPRGHYRALFDGAEGVSFVFDTSGLDAVHLFLAGPDKIAGRASDAIARLRDTGMLWISWTKKSSKLFRGVSEDDLRAAFLPLGWVDVKVCAIDSDWSGLKFLRRKDLA
ncbi:MAG: DUF3052 domain-containing protein [Pseudomonadota bacterium]